MAAMLWPKQDHGIIFFCNFNNSSLWLNLPHLVNNTTRVKNGNSAGYKFGHPALHTGKGYELTTPVSHSPLYVLAAVRILGGSVVPFMQE